MREYEVLDKVGVCDVRNNWEYLGLLNLIVMFRCGENIVIKVLLKMC